MQKVWLAVAAAMVALIPLTPAGASRPYPPDWEVGQHFTDAIFVISDLAAGCGPGVLIVELQKWEAHGDAPASDQIVFHNTYGPGGAPECETFSFSSSTGGPNVQLPLGSIQISTDNDTIHGVADLTITDDLFTHRTSTFHIDVTFHSSRSLGDHVATVTGTVTGDGRTWNLESQPWGSSWDEFDQQHAPFAWMDEYTLTDNGFQQLGNRRSIFDDYSYYFPRY